MAIQDQHVGQGRIGGVSRYVTPLLADIAAQAESADTTRSISADIVTALKSNDVVRMGASEEISGLNSSLVEIANELSALAPCCASTAWVIWNHSVLFHHVCGLLGPAHSSFLESIVSRGELVNQGVGPGSIVTGTRERGDVMINGVTAFVTGCRYGDWTGVGFMEDGKKALQFVLVNLQHPKVRIDPTWEAMSVRASATDHVYFDGVEVAAAHVVPWAIKDRTVYRDPDHPVIHQRYREDWTALAAMFLGVMASSVAETCLNEITTGSRDRIAVFDTKWIERPMVQVNIGRARALINAGADTAYAALQETDDRIDAGINPTEEFYLRQVLAGMQAIQLCDEAMNLMQRILGANGLREATNFERRYRDFQAMPLHIISHIDRMTEQSGRNALGLDTQNPF
jgi:alkylation response protein AidB-like acyl-CoA dehydrogenase